jgi:hypothetical protein
VPIAAQWAARLNPNTADHHLQRLTHSHHLYAHDEASQTSLGYIGGGDSKNNCGCLLGFSILHLPKLGAVDDFDSLHRTK